MSELSEKSATELVSLVGGRDVSVMEVARACLDRVHDYNPALNAIVTLNPQFLDESEESDRRLSSGGAIRSLEGVPFVVKDIIGTKGLRTTFGSVIYEHHIPTDDAITVERLRAAGAILLGKANTPEFATDINTTNKIFGLTRNPVNLNVSAGGSSGGSASAVAADMSPIALGTDLGGSIRIPSAWCGVCGMRPSPGRVPVHRPDFGWDTLVAHVEGPIARTVADLGLMLAAIAGPDDRDPSSLAGQGHDYAQAAHRPVSLNGRRIAYSADLSGLFPVDPEVEAATRAAAREFEAMGSIVEEASFDTSDVREIIAGTRGFGLVARFGDLVDRFHDKMAAQLVGQVSDAVQQDLRSVAKAERLRTQFWHRIRTFLERYDFILTPTVGAPPFCINKPLPTRIGHRSIERYYDIFLSTYAFSLVGLPAVSVPCGFTGSGLPIGLQIVGRRLRDDSVLGAAAAYAARCPQHFERRPIPLEEAVPLSGEVVTPGMRAG
jgi:amidase